MAAEASDAALDGGEIWRDMADIASRWRDMARYGEIWRDMARCAALIVAAAAASSASSNHVGVVATQAAVVRHETPGPRSPALGMCDTSTQRTSTAQILADPVRAERDCTSEKQEALQASCSPGCVRCGSTRRAIVEAYPCAYAAARNAPAGKSRNPQRGDISGRMLGEHLRHAECRVRLEARPDFLG